MVRKNKIEIFYQDLFEKGTSVIMVKPLINGTYDFKWVHSMNNWLNSITQDESSYFYLIEHYKYNGFIKMLDIYE